MRIEITERIIPSLSVKHRWHGKAGEKIILIWIKKVMLGTVLRSITIAVIPLSLLGCSAHQSLYVKNTDWEGIRWIAVMPFENISGRRGAGDVVTNIFIAELFNVGKYNIIKPGDVRDLLIDRQVRMKGELDFETLYVFREELRADGVVVGIVKEYGEGTDGSLRGVPKVSIAARMLDTSSGEIIWSADNSRYGNDRVVLLDIGRKRSVNDLAKATIAEMLHSLKKSSRERTKFVIPADADRGEDISMRLAELYYRRGRYDLSIPHLEYAVEKTTAKESSMDWLHKLGISYEHLGKWNQALDVWHKYRTSYPFSRISEIGFRIGRSQRHVGNYNESIRELETVLSSCENQWIDNSYVEIGDLFFDADEYEKAGTSYKKLIIEYPESELVPQALFRTGECLYRIKDYDGSIKILTDFLRIFPSDENTWRAEYIIGCAFQGIEKWQEALGSLQRALQGISDGAMKEEIKYRIGISHWYLGNYKWAEGYLSSADRTRLSLETADDMRLKLGNIHYASGDYARALAELGSLWAEGSADSQVIYKVARCNEELGMLEEAIRAYREVSSGDGGKLIEESLLRMGRIYKQLGEIDRAVDSLKKLTGIDSEYSDEAKITLAGIYFRQGNLDEALRIYRDVIETSQDPQLVTRARSWIRTIEFKREKMGRVEK